MNYERLLELKLSTLLSASKSILLLGPRQTGKSTLIGGLLEKRKEKSVVFQLQNIRTYQEILANPSFISNAIENELEKTKKIILYIDEVQKIPILLDDCQYLIDKYKERIKVILTGSSARKLRKQGVNLLPGRVIYESIHPLIFPEIFEQKNQYILETKPLSHNTQNNQINLEDLLIYGSLPMVLKEKNCEHRNSILESYVSIYLQEEIREEALVRNLGNFTRFLELSANESNHLLNYQNISQDSGISASTIKNYFFMLEDTLITHAIPPFIRRGRKQILSTPKFIYFDLGVKNTAAKLTLQKGKLNSVIAGKLFEELIILELIRRTKYFYPRAKYYFWRTNHGHEVDFIIEKEGEIIPIEIKYTNTIQDKHIKNLELFMDEYNIKKGYIVGTFSRPQKINDRIKAIPWNEI